MEDNRNVELGGLIAKWRRAAGLTQAALADTLGTQQTTVSKLEAGFYRLTVVQMLSILDACGISLPDVAEDIQRVASAGDVPIWERVNE